MCWLILLKMHEDGGNDLRVLVADQFGNRHCIHPLETFYAIGIAALEDARIRFAALSSPSALVSTERT